MWLLLVAEDVVQGEEGVSFIFFRFSGLFGRNVSNGRGWNGTSAIEWNEGF